MDSPLWEEVAREQAELWVQFASCGSHLQAGLAYEFLADLTRTKRLLTSRAAQQSYFRSFKVLAWVFGGTMKSISAVWNKGTWIRAEFERYVFPPEMRMPL